MRVRSADEILGTLDGDGTLDGLPFMPEMLAYCGRTMAVSKTATKTCDGKGTVRAMNDAVFLTGARCDGSAHDGCQAACLIHWKEAWLERVDAGSALEAGGNHRYPGLTYRSVADRVAAPSRPAPDGGRVYQCQATEILTATRPLPPWEPTQYVHDLRNWGFPKLVRNLAVTLFNRLQDVSRHWPRWLRLRGGARHPVVGGRLTRTPSATLGLQPGDLVRVKSREQIAATLDTRNRTRGLAFDVEMLRYCGQTARVAQRVERIIDEQTGHMIKIDSDCVTLEGFVCQADYHRLCTRQVYEYWREIWLEKLE